ncbi:hypothetical protein DXG01_008828, partial [Tephrocybe rancida]
MLSARLSLIHAQNLKLAAHTLRRLLASSPAMYPLHMQAHLHLELIYVLESSSADISKPLAALGRLSPALGPLCGLIRLQLFVMRGLWAQVPQALEEVEALFPAVSPPTTPAPDPASSASAANESKTEEVKQNIPPTLRAHLLTLGVLFHTYAGDAAAAGTRLGALHALMDTGVLDPTSKNKDRWEGWEEGVVE